MSTRRDKHDKPQTLPPPVVPSAAVAVAKWGGTVALVAAAAMSVQTLYSLGRILGYAKWNAWLLPTSLDVYAATAIWVGHRVPAEHKARKTATANARIALVLTVSANGLFHLLNLPGVRLPHWVSITLLVLVSALPPFVVERILHLQMTVSVGRTEARIDSAESGNANSAPAPTAPTVAAVANANPAPPIATANDNPAPTANRQADRPRAAKEAASDNSQNDSSAGATEALVAAALPAYRQILAENTAKRLATGTPKNPRPTAPQLVAAVPGLNTDSRAKQIREVIERRFPDLAPRLRAAEIVEQVS